MQYTHTNPLFSTCSRRAVCISQLIMPDVGNLFKNVHNQAAEQRCKRILFKCNAHFCYHICTTIISSFVFFCIPFLSLPIHLYALAFVLFDSELPPRHRNLISVIALHTISAKWLHSTLALPSIWRKLLVFPHLKCHSEALESGAVNA